MTNNKYEIIIRTEDGGVADIYHNGEHFVTTYYQNRDNNLEINWEKLAEGKSYSKDWDAEITIVNSTMINDAITWLGIKEEVESK
jgi:hypothetical protein